MKPDHNSVKKSSKDNPIRKESFSEKELTFQEIKAVLESSPAGIGIIKDRVIVWSNNILSSMLGYERNSLKGVNTRCFYADQKEYDRVGLELYSKLDNKGKGSVETTLLKKNGNLIDCMIKVSRLSTQDSSKGFIFIINDISGLKRIQVQAS